MTALDHLLITILIVATLMVFAFMLFTGNAIYRHGLLAEPIAGNFQAAAKGNRLDFSSYQSKDQSRWPN